MKDCHSTEHIVDHVGIAAILENTAEEAAELAHAALKLARVIRGENWTPRTKEECMKNLVEEIADVEVLISILWGSGLVDLQDICRITGEKLARWQRRIEENNEG